MTQDLKCFFNIHKLENIEVIEVKNQYNETTKKIYVNRCTNCGRIISKHINYEPY